MAGGGVGCKPQRKTPGPSGPGVLLSG